MLYLSTTAAVYAYDQRPELMLSSTAVYASYDHRLSLSASTRFTLKALLTQEDEEDVDDPEEQQQIQNHNAAPFRVQFSPKSSTSSEHGQTMHSSVPGKPLRKQQSQEEITACEETIRALVQHDRLQGAVESLLRMTHIPSVETYWLLLKACRKEERLPEIRLMYYHLAFNGLDITRFLGESIVIAFCQCSGLSEAYSLFHRLPRRTALSWEALISAYINHGMCTDALALYPRMLEDDIEPNKYVFVSLIRCCSTISDMQWGQYIHSQAVKYSCVSELYVASCLIDMYVKCGSLDHAQDVFDTISHHDAVSLNSMMLAYLEHEMPQKALHLFELMRDRGISPNERTFMFGIQACCSLSHQNPMFLSDDQDMDKAWMIHSAVVCHGFDLDVYVGSTLVNFYGSHGYILEARYVFDALPDRDVVSITAMLSAYVEQGQGRKALELYENLPEQGVTPDEQTVTIALQACCTLAEDEESRPMSLHIGRSMHTDAALKGCDSGTFVGDSLVNMYGKCGSSLDAQYVFSQIHVRSSASWNAVISGHVWDGDGEKALQAYRLMQEDDVTPNEQTLVIALQACSLLADAEESVDIQGKSKKVMSEEICQTLHAVARRRGFDSNAFVGSSLVNLYGKLINVGYAQHAFRQVAYHDVVSWTAMLMCYLDVGDSMKSLQLYKLMQEEGVRPNAQTAVVGIQACCELAELEESDTPRSHSIKAMAIELGQALHVDVQRNRFESNAFVCSALVEMYGKWGNIREAEEVFQLIDSPDVVLWNTMLSMYVEQGNAEKALQMYDIMLGKGVGVDHTSITCVLNACRWCGYLDGCQNAHFSVLSLGYDLDLALMTSLIFAYGDCSSMLDAREVFMRLSDTDTSSWNALLCGYAKEGNYSECFRLFQKMVAGSGIELDKITFAALLLVCNHAGLLDESMEILESMRRDYGLAPDMEHYTCAVDVLGRAGNFTKVEELFSRMPITPDLTVILCLLSACQKHGNVSLGEHLFHHAVKLQPLQDTPYVMMSNIYADAGLPDTIYFL